MSNSHPCEKRLKQELQAMQKNPPPLCTAATRGDDLFKWTAIIQGPPDSVYEGGSFYLNLDFSDKYPFEPPKVCFTTKIYHCNVSESGYICLDILNSQWAPILRVSTLLLSICSLMTDPNPYSPLRQDIALLYKWKRDQHDKEARAATKTHAMPK